MCSSVVKTFFSVLCIGCAVSEEVTHMPSLKDATLAPAIILALKGEKTTSKNCLKDTTKALRYLLHVAPKQSRWNSSYSQNILGITPCEKCKVLLTDLDEFFIIDVATYDIGEYDSVKNLLIGIPKVHTRCEKCHLTDDDGVEYVGEIYDTWINPQVNIVSLGEIFPDAAEIKVKIVLLNVTSVQEKEVSCKGVEQFKNICKQVYQTGELDHIFHASMETLFNGRFDRFEGLKVSSDEYKILDEAAQAFLMC